MELKDLDILRVREVRQDEMKMLEAPREKARPLRRIGERHHALARALASGMPDWQASATTGYDHAYISILKADPTFRELLEFYRDKTNVQYEDMHAQLAGLSFDAIVELRHRLEEQPEKLRSEELKELIRLGADRTGFGPSSRQEVNVNVGLAERLERARQRVIDITPEKKDAA